MTTTEEATLWPQLIRRNTVALVVLVGFLGVAIVAFVSWSNRTSEASLGIINNYHLASAHNCADAREQIRHLVTNTILSVAEIDEMMRARFMAHETESSTNVTFHLAKTNIQGVLDLQRKFNDAKFAFLAERLERELANFVADFAKNHTKTIEFSHRIDILQSALVTLDQLERLHIITLEDMSAKLVESKMRNAGVLIAIVLAVALIGYLFMRRGLGAIDAVIDRQVNIEQALRTSEDQFRAVVEGTAAAISLKDIEGKFLLVNNRFASWFAAEPSDIVGRKVDDFLDPGEIPDVEASDAEVRGNRTSIREEDRTYPDGVRRAVVIHKSPITDPEGTVTAIATVLTDVTDRKISEDAVQQSEALLRSFIDYSPAIISLTDLEGRLRLANKAFLSAFGVSQEKAIGGKVDDIVVADHATVRDSHETEVVETGDAITQERIGFERLGKATHRLVTKFPIRDNYGDITGVGSIGTDVSELRRAEKELRALEARMSDILRIAPEVIISTDVHGEVVMFNDAAESTFGYERDELIGKSLDVLLPEQVRSAHGAHIKAFVEGAGTQRLMGGRGEINGRRRDGSIFPANASISKLQSVGETILTVTMHDITDRKRAEEDLRLALVEAERANQAKTEFLATMSHELRTPLNAIIGFSQTMAGQYFGALGSDRYVEYANDIGNSGEHLLQLINDLLDLSAIEAGKHTLQKESLHIDEIVEDMDAIVREGANRKGQSYACDIPENLPTIYADRRSLKQVILNLLSNATKFTPEGGKISLHARDSNDALIIEVGDTGPGIPKHRLATLTEPFMRGETDPHKSQEGTGLGLAIVKSLVDLHDGELMINSEEGVGTTVTVTLPLGED